MYSWQKKTNTLWLASSCVFYPDCMYIQLAEEDQHFIVGEFLRVLSRLHVQLLAEEDQHFFIVGEFLRVLSRLHVHTAGRRRPTLHCWRVLACSI
jgi:hypothetical protein